MNTEIKLEDILEFSKKYRENKENKKIENEITKLGLEEACYRKEIVDDNPFVFNIELPEGNIYNQKENHKCWIYAGLNVIKYDVAKNMNIDLKELELSEEYIAFFDKLEKTNTIYETVIDMKEDYNCKEVIRKVKMYMTEAGYFSMFAAIVEKYGIVPSSVMQKSFEDSNFQKIENVLTEKVKKDILLLINMKKENQAREKLEIKKKEFLQENYEMLSKILGEPVHEFNYSYKNKNKEKKVEKCITPMHFKEKYLKIDLNDFVAIGNFVNGDKEFNEMYLKSKIQNVIGKSEVKYLNLPIEELKKMVLEQLKDGLPVWSGMYIRKGENEKLGILDTRLYDYENMIGLKTLTKKEGLETQDIFIHHAMTICGVYIENEKPIRWKVEDSYGENEKIKGYYVMNDNYFDKFILNVIVNKKYLNNRQKELLENDVIYSGEEEMF